MKKILILIATLVAFLSTSGIAHARDYGSTSSKTQATKVVSKKKLKTQKRSRVRAEQAARRSAESGPAYNADGPILRSSSALVVDQETGNLLYAKNPDRETPIASITKLMTAMVTLDAGLPLSEEITVESEDVDRLKGTRSRLALGATLAREELLHLALIASENRAAAALSRAYPGGREAFVTAMNAKARELGMQHTYFVDGTGLSSDNRSTAADLVRLVDAAYRYPLISRISTTGDYDVLVAGARRDRHLEVHNTNALTRREGWSIGISKTGYISEAGHCLVMQAEIAQQKVIIVLLDSWGKWSRIGDANRVRKWLEHGLTERVAKKGGADSV